ncbi:MAG TPA: bifunctional diguanylate cyclase/phosphodiesterase, partial [Frankiaceae bacterium]|nr:bifunctional diguanylate cyclase/phosphodiesterase [Frankiaceae bacterium]
MADGEPVSEETAPAAETAPTSAAAPTRRSRFAPIDRLIILTSVLGLAAVCGAVVQWSTMGWSFPVAAVCVCLALALVCELAEVQVALGARRFGLAWGETSLIIGLAFVPLPLLVLMKTVAIFVEHRYRRRDWRRTLFNTLNTPLTVYAAAGAFLLMVEPFGIKVGSPASWPALAVTGLVATVVLSCWVAGAVSATGGGQWLAVARSTTFGYLANCGANIAVSLLCLAAWRYSRASLLALPLLFILVWQVNDRQMQKGTERDALRRLAAASASMPALSLVEMTDEVRRRAADLFGARSVQLRLSEPSAQRLIAQVEPSVEESGVVVELIGRKGSLGFLALDVAQSGRLTRQERDVLVTFANTTAAALETVLAHAEQLHTAQHDSLTGLPNRALLAENAERTLAAANASGNRCALILLDLNGFKNVNDTLGHAAGDQLLVEIGSRLASSVRVNDCVARLGGDEFVVLLDRLEGEVDAGRLAATLVERISVPVTIDGLRLAVEASAGVSIYPDDGTTIDNLLRCADVAMYDAKRRGDSVVHYDPSQDLASPERLGLLADLQSALDADDQLHLHFQPQLDLRTGLPGNVEALVRWKHPTRGNLSPAEFVPVIEHSALIGPFTAKVLEEAVRCCVSWQSDASLHGVGVAVNLSARNLMHRDLPD